MRKDILYSIAATSAGQLVKALDADRGQPYFCAVCRHDMVLRKGSRKRPHFAHKTLSPNCTTETALHYGFKTLLYQKVQHHINQQIPLPIQWACQFCRKPHSGNLLKKACRIEMEYDLGVCQPDLALFDSDSQLVAVIEIVVTHSPEPEVKTYFEKQHIPIALFCLQSDEDLNRLDASILVPNELDLCFNPRCQKCDRFMKNREIWIQRSTCWKCNSTMVVAAVDERDAYRGLTCNFSLEELQWLKEKGANIEHRYSKTTRESYFANVCM